MEPLCWDGVELWNLCDNFFYHRLWGQFGFPFVLWRLAQVCQMFACLSGLSYFPGSRLVADGNWTRPSALRGGKVTSGTSSESVLAGERRRVKNVFLVHLDS